MIIEDYVSPEIAKLLKEKGFDEECWNAYTGNNWTYEPPFKNSEFNLDAEKSFFTIPTLQMAVKWLREVHNIYVVPKFDFYAGNYTGRIYDGRRESTIEKDDYIAIVGNSTYEEACEAAIKYCLENLI